MAVYMPHITDDGVTATGCWPKTGVVIDYIIYSPTRSNTAGAIRLSRLAGGLPAIPWMLRDHLATEADNFSYVYQNVAAKMKCSEHHIGRLLTQVSTYNDFVPFVVPGGLPFLRRMVTGLTLTLSRTSVLRISSDLTLTMPVTQIP